MKDYKPRYEELYKYYQVWLTDFTKLTVRSGMCHQNIYLHHTLTVGSLKFPGEEEVIAIVPQCLHRIIYGRAAAPLTVNDECQFIYPGASAGSPSNAGGGFAV